VRRSQCQRPNGAPFAGFDRIGSHAERELQSCVYKPAIHNHGYYLLRCEADQGFDVWIVNIRTQAAPAGKPASAEPKERRDTMRTLLLATVAAIGLATAGTGLAARAPTSSYQIPVQLAAGGGSHPDAETDRASGQQYASAGKPQADTAPQQKFAQGWHPQSDTDRRSSQYAQGWHPQGETDRQSAQYAQGWHPQSDTDRQSSQYALGGHPQSDTDRSSSQLAGGWYPGATQQRTEAAANVQLAAGGGWHPQENTDEHGTNAA
jgi:hypothetical protein